MGLGGFRSLVRDLFSTFLKIDVRVVVHIKKFTFSHNRHVKIFFVIILVRIAFSWDLCLHGMYRYQYQQSGGRNLVVQMARADFCATPIAHGLKSSAQ